MSGIMLETLETSGEEFPIMEDRFQDSEFSGPDLVRRSPLRHLSNDAWGEDHQPRRDRDMHVFHSPRRRHSRHQGPQREPSRRHPSVGWRRSLRRDIYNLRVQAHCHRQQSRLQHDGQTVEKSLLWDNQCLPVARWHFQKPGQKVQWPNENILSANSSPDQLS